MGELLWFDTYLNNPNEIITTFSGLSTVSELLDKTSLAKRLETKEPSPMFPEHLLD